MVLEDKVVALVCVGAEPAVLRQVTEHLEMEGYEVVCSACASEAKALLQSDTTPAVIVMSLAGLLARRELSRSILMDARFEHAPLISIAGAEQVDQLMRYREVDAWFDAPVDLPGLTQTLEWLQPTEALQLVAA
jgi:CheY-like chemotaxis protein